MRLTAGPLGLLVLSKRQQKLRVSQVLIGRCSRQQGGLDDLVYGGGPACRKVGLWRDGYVAELSSEICRTEAAILLYTDPSILAE